MAYLAKHGTIRPWQSCCLPSASAMAWKPTKDAVPDTAALPAAEAAVHRRPFAELLRKVAPVQRRAAGRTSSPSLLHPWGWRRAIVGRRVRALVQRRAAGQVVTRPYSGFCSTRFLSKLPFSLREWVGG